MGSVRFLLLQCLLFLFFTRGTSFAEENEFKPRNLKSVASPNDHTKYKTNGFAKVNNTRMGDFLSKFLLGLVDGEEFTYRPSGRRKRSANQFENILKEETSHFHNTSISRWIFGKHQHGCQSAQCKIEELNVKIRKQIEVRKIYKIHESKHNISQEDHVEESELEVNAESEFEATKTIENLDSETFTTNTNEMPYNFSDSVKIDGYYTTSRDNMVKTETLNFTYKSPKQPSRILQNNTSENVINNITEARYNFTNNYKDNVRYSTIPFSNIFFDEKDITKFVRKDALLNTSIFELISGKPLNSQKENGSIKHDYIETEIENEANMKQDGADNFKFRKQNNSALKGIQNEILNILRDLQKPDRDSIRAELYKIIKDIYSNYNDSDVDAFNTNASDLLHPEIFETETVGFENKTYEKGDNSTSVMPLGRKTIDNISVVSHATAENVVAVSETFDFTKSEREKTYSKSNDSVNQSHYYEEIRTSKYEVSKKPDNALLSDTPYNISKILYPDYNGSATDGTDTSTNLLTIKDITENETLGFGELDSSSNNSGVQTHSHGDIEPNIYIDFRKNKEKKVTHEIITSPASQLNITESTSVIYTWDGKSATELGDSSEIITEEVLSFTDHTNDTNETDSKNKITLNIIAFTNAPNLESNTMEVQSNFSDIQNSDVIGDSSLLGNNQRSDQILIKDVSTIKTLNINDMRNATEHLYLAYTSEKSDIKLTSAAFKKTEEIAKVILPTLTTNTKDSKEDKTILHATLPHLHSTTMSMIIWNSKHTNNLFFTNVTSDNVDNTKTDITTSSSIITPEIRKENITFKETFFEVNSETLNNNVTNIEDEKVPNEHRDIYMNVRDKANAQTVSQTTSILNAFTNLQDEEKMVESLEFNHTEQLDQSSEKMTAAFENAPNVLHKENESEKSILFKDKLIFKKSGEDFTESAKPVNVRPTNSSTTYFNSSEYVGYIHMLTKSQTLMNESDILTNTFTEDDNKSYISNTTDYSLDKNETELTESSAISFRNTATGTYIENSEILYKNNGKSEVGDVKTTVSLDNLNNAVANKFNNTSSSTKDYGSNKYDTDPTLDHVSLHKAKDVDGDKFTTMATPATTIGQINAFKFLYYPSMNVTTRPSQSTYEYQIHNNVNRENLNNTVVNIEDEEDSNENQDISMNMSGQANFQTVSQTRGILKAFTYLQDEEKMVESFEFNHTEQLDQSSEKLTAAFENSPNVVPKGNESKESNLFKDKLISEKSGEDFTESAKPVNVRPTNSSTTYFNSSEDGRYIHMLTESQTLMNESDILTNIFTEDDNKSYISNTTDYSLDKNETELTESSAIYFSNILTRTYVENSKNFYKYNRKSEVGDVETTMNLENLNNRVANKINNTSSLTKDYGSYENETNATLDHVSSYKAKNVDGDEFTTMATPATTIGQINAFKFLYYPSMNVTTRPSPSTYEYQTHNSVNRENLNSTVLNAEDEKDSNENQEISTNIRDQTNPHVVSQTTSILNEFTNLQDEEKMVESFEFNHTEQLDQSSEKMTAAFENVLNVLHKGNETEKSNLFKDKLIDEKSGEDFTESSKSVNITSTHSLTTYFNSSEDVEYIHMLTERQSLMNESDIKINNFSENGTTSYVSNMTDYILDKNESKSTETSVVSFASTMTSEYIKNSEILYKNSRRTEVGDDEKTKMLSNLNKTVAGKFNNTSSLIQDYGSYENGTDTTLDHVSLYKIKNVDGNEFTTIATSVTTIGQLNVPKFLYYPSINVTIKPPTHPPIPPPTYKYPIPYVIKSIPIVNNDTGDVYYRTINVTLDKLDYIRLNNLSQYEEYMVYLREYFNQYAGRDDSHDRYKRSAPISEITRNFRNYFYRGALIRSSSHFKDDLLSRSDALSKLHKIISLKLRNLEKILTNIMNLVNRYFAELFETNGNK